MKNLESLHVYFGKNFWCVQGDHPAQPLAAGVNFTVGKNRCCIPAFYLSDEGLSADILVFFEPEPIQQFLNKFSGCIDHPTPIEEWLIEAEHPIPDMDFTIRLANGKPMGGERTLSGFTHIPFLPENQAEPAIDAVLKAYSPFYMPDECWKCLRIHVPWGSGRPERLSSVSLEATVSPSALSVNCPFTLDEATAVGCAVPFCHPATGQMHTLYVNEFEFLHRGPTPRLPHLPECWIPAFAYEVVPPLAPDESLELMETDFSDITSDGPACVSAVSFADNGLPGIHGEKLHPANGWMRPERGGSVHMSILGIRSSRGSSLRYTFEL